MLTPFLSVGTLDGSIDTLTAFRHEIDAMIARHTELRNRLHQKRLELTMHTTTPEVGSTSRSPLFVPNNSNSQNGKTTTAPHSGDSELSEPAQADELNLSIHMQREMELIRHQHQHNVPFLIALLVDIFNALLCV